MLCRSTSFPMARFAGSAPADRDYATAEFRALVVELAARARRSRRQRRRRRVLDRADVDRTARPRRGPARRTARRDSVVATSARLVPAFSGSPYAARMPWMDVAGPPVEQVLVAGSQAFGRLADRFGAACTILAERVRLPIARGVVLHRRGGRRGRLGACRRCPPCRPCARPWGVEAVARLLESIAERTRRAGGSGRAPMILFFGYADDPTLLLTIELARDRGIDHIVVDQRSSDRYDLVLEVGDAGVGGDLCIEGSVVRLAAISSVYARPLTPVRVRRSARPPARRRVRPGDARVAGRRRVSRRQPARRRCIRTPPSRSRHRRSGRRGCGSRRRS